jgi:hypothetical protein
MMIMTMLASLLAREIISIKKDLEREIFSLTIWKKNLGKNFRPKQQRLLSKQKLRKRSPSLQMA